MGKAKDGSECYTRQNKAGGSYVTCEGSQQARQKFAGELRGLLNVSEKPKPKPKVDWSRSDTVRGRSRRAAKARRLTTRPPGRIETGSINTGSVITDFDMSSFVQERPGVVGMTTNMSGIEAANYDGLFGGAAEPEPVSVYQQRLKERGLDTDITGNEARLMSEFKNEPTFISGSDDEFIEQILQAVGWSPDFAPLSAAQRKRLLSTRGKNNMFIKPNRGMGGVDQKNTRMIEIGEFSEGVRGRVVFKFLPKIRLKYLG